MQKLKSKADATREIEMMFLQAEQQLHNLQIQVAELNNQLNAGDFTASDNAQLNDRR